MIQNNRNLPRINEIYRSIAAASVLVVGVVAAFAKVFDLTFELSQKNPYLATIVVILAALALTGVTIFVTIKIMRRPIMWKKYGLQMESPLSSTPREVKPINKHQVFVDKEGTLSVKESKLIVNLDKERHITMSSTFYSTRPLTLKDLNIKTNAEKIEYPQKLGTTYLRIDFQSTNTVRPYEPYLQELEWKLDKIYARETLNWFVLPLVNFEGEHDIELSTDNMPITWYFCDELNDMSMLSSDERANDYVKHAELQPKIPQPNEVSKYKINWHIRTPRNDRSYVLFFKYS